MRTTALFLSGALFAVAASAAEDFTPEQKDFFDKKIKPILTDKCYKCHSNDAGKSKGGLLLDSREASLKGGDTGAAVVPGNVEKSLLITAVTYKDKDLQMPPKGEKLSDAEIADLTQWVKDGAADTRAAVAKGKLSGLTDKARQHWAYQPVVKPAIPNIKNRAWCVTPVDAFILQKLEEKNMVPSPPADKEMLLRRASFDLTGLPPTPKEIVDFTSDNSPYAFVKVVDRLLASPHYGERWGRFWLDSARYSDTTGDRLNNRNTDYRFPYAWTYRDYVVRAFNEDKPYDRFIVEQLAADKLTDLKDQRDLAALGFISVGKRGNNVNDLIDDRIDTVSKGFLAMTVACARCHDHMFDPIPTKDYYALHGVFASIDEPKDKPVISQAGAEAAAAFQKKMDALEQANRDNYYKLGVENNADFRKNAATYLKVWYLTRPSMSAEDQKKGGDIRAEAKLDREVTRSVNRVGREEAIFGPLRNFSPGKWGALNWDKLNPVVAAAFKGLTPQNVDEVVAVYAKIFNGISAKADALQKALAAAKDSQGALAAINPADAQLIQFPLTLSPAYELTTEQIRKEVDNWPLGLRNRGWAFNKINNLLLTDSGNDARAMVVEDKPTPTNSPVFIRGLVENKGDVVPRHFLEILSGGKPTPFKLGSGRLELAQAIASKNNPLTARVIVNRVWLHHFGEGFVRTPDDLGTQAEKPSHPELLDYLSSYLMEQGWSLKKLHRLIMLSKVYQETSSISDNGRTTTATEYANIDPDNRLLWRANVRRLDFEAMRDSLLVMAKNLDETVGGQPVNLTDEPYSYRRTIYGYVDRGNLPELMSHFDFSNPEAPNSKRTTTVVPQQALFLMNSPMAIDVARHILTQPVIAQAKTNNDRIIGIYRIVLGRTPSADEFRIAYSFLGEELRLQDKVAAEAKDMTEKAEKKAEERAKRNGNMADNNGFAAIQNEGATIERKPLTAWETYAHALLLSNEAAYVN
ncbi:MAG: PSD1 and planctomycete cytochrome C domain-containing protein [Chthoniobacter sp.]